MYEKLQRPETMLRGTALAGEQIDVACGVRFMVALARPTG